jgi:integrase
VDVSGYRGFVLAIPKERMKSRREHVLPLIDIFAVGDGAQTAESFLFSGDGGKTAISGFSKLKAALDKRLPANMKPWTLHDLRRTAKTLMARAGVRPDISERVLSHVIPGVEGIYDRWGYLTEKRDALLKLDALLKRILSGAEVIDTSAAMLVETMDQFAKRHGIEPSQVIYSLEQRDPDNPSKITLILEKADD